MHTPLKLIGGREPTRIEVDGEQFVLVKTTDEGIELTVSETIDTAAIILSPAQAAGVYYALKRRLLL